MNRQQVEMVMCEISAFHVDFAERIAQLERRCRRQAVEVVTRDSRECPRGKLLLYVCPFTRKQQPACRIVVLHRAADWEQVNRLMTDHPMSRLASFEESGAAAGG